MNDELFDLAPVSCEIKSKMIHYEAGSVNSIVYNLYM
jgi:hypothetical protein